MSFVYGFIAGLALLVGALIGIIFKPSKMVSAAIMAFGSGVLISALTFDLIEEAYRIGGVFSISIGFLTGAVFFVMADWLIGKRGGHHRKKLKGERSGSKEGNSLAITFGALLDGIPESVMIGAGLLTGFSAGITMFAAVFLSNIPEGISGVQGVTGAKKSRELALAVWALIALACGLASFMGYKYLAGAPSYVLALTQSIAAGSILAMITDTMIPEAFEEGGVFVALATVLGFLLAFIISRLS